MAQGDISQRKADHIAIAASGISSDSVKEEFEQHAKEEQGHMREVAERINQLGGTPNFNPEGLLSRSASEYTATVEMPSSLQAQITRRAISPRFATSIFWNMFSAT